MTVSDVGSTAVIVFSGTVSGVTVEANAGEIFVRRKAKSRTKEMMLFLKSLLIISPSFELFISVSDGKDR